MLDTSEKAKLVWRCRRGMLELDLIFHDFIKHIDKCSREEIDALNVLLDNTDPQLLAWLMEHEDPEDKEVLTIVNLIRNTTRTDNKTSKI